MSARPVVVILGRPNVGKSTLVNRIVRRKSAVVDEQAGVTRDRREFDGEWNGRDFVIVDTGGWEHRPGEQLTADIREQAEIAVKGADVAVFVTDGTTDITDDDLGVARVLQRSEIPYVLAANKVDGPAGELTLDHLWGLGLGEPIPISALHGRNTGDLLDHLVDLFPAGDGEGGKGSDDDAIASLAIIGRPNVGKSTLLNKLAGYERVLVSEVPGTTRDPINLVVDLDGEPFEIIDTAGIKRRTKINDAVERYAVLRARDVLRDADVAMLMIDGTKGATHQDQRLAEEIVDAGVGLVLVLNKWDIRDEDERLHTEDSVGDRLAFVDWAPILRISAKTGSRLHRLPAAVKTVLENWRRRIPTPELNRFIRSLQEAHPPPVRKGRRPNIIYSVQAETEPPTVILFVRGGDLSVDYLRFIENRLRESYDFTGTPVRVITRKRQRRYE